GGRQRGAQSQQQDEAGQGFCLIEYAHGATSSGDGRKAKPRAMSHGGFGSPQFKEGDAFRAPLSLPSRLKSLHRSDLPRRDGSKSGAFGIYLVLVGLAQHVAAAPDGLDVVLAAGSDGELLAELADEDVDDLQ